MSEEVLEAEAIEEPAPDGEIEPEVATRPLPVHPRRGELDAWRGDVRTAALAAAGGVVAGVATIAAVNAARSVGARRAKPRPRRRQSKHDRVANVVASRSFLIDVHVLGR